MANNALSKVREMLPSAFDDFFKPWNEWFEGGLLHKTMSMPAVNITEEDGNYTVTMAAPGMKKDDFNVDIDNNMITISAETEKEKEEDKKKYTRKEYSYSSFSRSFTLPDDVEKNKIDAKYDNGVLTLNLPKKEAAKQNNTQKINVN